MSYAIGTPNFNLPQTQGSDKRDWADTNQAFADIDSAIKTAGDDSTLALSAAQTAQTSADGAVTDAASAVSTANAAASQAATASELASLARTEAQSAVTTAQSAQSTAQSAQSTATNADTVALAAQTNIGTMSQLQTTDKSSLVAAINEVVGQIGGAMRCAKFGTFTVTNDNKSATIDISDLNLSSSEDYMVIFDCQGHSISTSTTTTGAGSVSLTAKTATSFTITSKSVNTVDGSYQVITFG